MDAGLGGVEDEEWGFEAEVEEEDAALAISDGEEEVGGGGGVVGEEVAAEGERGPADGGNEGGERGGGGRREGDDRDQLHGPGVDDAEAAAGGVGQEAGGAEVGGSAIVAGRWTREHAVPRLLRWSWNRHCCVFW